LAEDWAAAFVDANTVASAFEAKPSSISWQLTRPALRLLLPRV